MNPTTQVTTVWAMIRDAADAAMIRDETYGVVFMSNPRNVELQARKQAAESLLWAVVSGRVSGQVVCTLATWGRIGLGGLVLEYQQNGGPMDQAPAFLRDAIARDAA